MPALKRALYEISCGRKILQWVHELRREGRAPCYVASTELNVRMSAQSRQLGGPQGEGMEAGFGGAIAWGRIG